MEDRRQIVAAGGAFSEVLGYVLERSARERPRVLWVGTAHNEDASAALAIHDLVRGRAEFDHLRFNPWPRPSCPRWPSVRT